MPQLIELESTPDRVEQVWRALLDAICDGSLAPGTRLTQEEIAEQLAVSRQPVLQALRLLKKDGLLIDAPGRGVCVSPLDGQHLLRIYQVRGALDALAADLAAQRRCRISPDIIASGRQALKNGDIKAMLLADVRFHSAIYQASGNPLIEQSAQLHWAHIRRAMGAVLQVSSMRASIWDEHEAIAQAIARGDAEQARQLSARRAATWRASCPGPWPAQAARQAPTHPTPYPTPHPRPSQESAHETDRTTDRAI
jgi:DNA-binding GntR family transcriptional regulator